MTTVDEVAEHLKLSASKVYQMAQRGEIPCTKVGGRWRCLRSEIDDWMVKMRPAHGKKGPDSAAE